MVAPAGSQDADSPTPRRSVLREVVGWVVGLALVAAFAGALGGRWRDVVRDVSSLPAGAVGAAFALCLVGVALTYAAWRVVLADLGAPVGWRAGARIFFVGQLGKYLPGSVWPVLVQMRLGRELGLPRSRVALAFLVTFGMSLAWGLVVGLVAVPVLVADAGWAAAALLLLLPVAAFVLHPRVLDAGVRRLLRLLRRPPLPRPVSGRAVAVAGAAIVGFWVLGGLHIWVLAVALGAPAGAGLVAAVGGFALAFCAGPLVVLAPAGAGVREAVLVTVLLPVLSTPAAAAVALVSRLLLVVVDGLLAAASAAAPGRR